MADQNPLDILADRLADDLERHVENMPEAATPFGAKRLSRAEQLSHYLDVRDDPARWSQIIDEQGLRETIKYAQTMERELQKELDGYTTTSGTDADLGILGGGSDGGQAEV